MQYVEAFKKLGYQVQNQRQDWSAECDHGVCITLWKSEVEWSPSPPRFDLRKLHPKGSDFEKLPGHKKRLGHLDRAVRDFGGFVDVIIVTGTPGESYQNAEPWMVKERRNHIWKIVEFDGNTGYFAAHAVPKEPGA